MLVPRCYQVRSKKILHVVFLQLLLWTSDTKVTVMKQCVM